MGGVQTNNIYIIFEAFLRPSKKVRRWPTFLLWKVDFICRFCSIYGVRWIGI